MRTSGILIILCSAAAVSLTAQAGPVDDCNSDEPALVISGCSALIEKGDLDNAELEIAYSRRSDALLASGKLDKAIGDREKALSLNPSDGNLKKRLADAYIARGEARVVNGKLSLMIGDYSKAIELVPQDENLKKRLATAHLQRGDGFVKTGKLDDALADYSRSIELDPTNDTVLARRSEIFLAKEDVAKAISDLTEAWRLNSDSADYRERLAKLNQLQAIRQLEEEDFNGAVASYSRALEANPDDIKLLAMRASAFVAAGDRKQAIEDYSHIIRLQLSNVEARLLRGELRLADGETKQAIADFGEVLKLEKKNMRALILRGLAYEKEGKREAALSDYQTALKIDSASEDAKTGRARIRRSAQDIVRLVQVELKRTGCDPGKIDGKWGRGSKAALAELKKYAKLKLDSNAPDEALLEIVSRIEGKACPVVKSCFAFNSRKFCEYEYRESAPENLPEIFISLVGKTLSCGHPQDKNMKELIYITRKRIYVGKKYKSDVDPNGAVFEVGSKRKFNYSTGYNISETSITNEHIKLFNYFIWRDAPGSRFYVRSRAQISYSNGKWFYLYKAKQWMNRGRRAAVPNVSEKRECRLIEGHLFEVR